MTRSEQRAAGQALRTRVPRRGHAKWRPPADRADPVEVLIRTNQDRLPALVPIRHGRMTESPFAYYRGAPAMMAADLSRTLVTGVTLQICGDAHLLNFGSFATPERNLVFDVNDFDETQPGPWEWDLKRLAASLVIAARTAGLGDADGETAVLACSAAYRSEMAAMSELSAFEVWHARIDAAALLAAAPDPRSRRVVERGVSKARQRTSLQALAKLTTVRAGRRVILEDPPLVSRLTDEQVQQARRSVRAYLASLDADRRVLLDRYELVDAALKVVGVGSVGTRCFIVLLAGKADLDPLFLQIKEAGASVLAPYVRRSRFENHGRRVVVGQRIMQAGSDTFLGWARIDGFDFYVRQLRDMKLSVRLESVRPTDLAVYGRLCGATLARAHARAGEPAVLAGYLGSSAVFDEALAAFAVGYADQNERDYEAFLGAIRAGRLETHAGSG
ncbi:MAG TPA: DUF2252 domain-containing protein [Acidimicrobiales bacterium]|nr:DUF2252 domain-containing protein [Acidimicrobiales bacterium]